MREYHSLSACSPRKALLHLRHVIDVMTRRHRRVEAITKGRLTHSAMFNMSAHVSALTLSGNHPSVYFTFPSQWKISHLALPGAR